MGILRFAIGANYKKFYKNLKDISKKENKSIVGMLFDTVLSAAIFGSGLTDYLNYEFYKKSFPERRRYVTIRTQDSFYSKVSPAKYKKTFTVKPNFLKEFSAYTKRQFIYPAENGINELKTFLDANPIFMEKPIDGLAGSRVIKKTTSEISNVETYYQYLSDNHLFVEQYIIQHEKLSALCDRSVNTVRVITSSTSGTPKIIFACLRIGNGNADIDNFHGGGMAVLVNRETGTLTGDAIDKALHHYRVHPVSNIEFDGYTLPFWEEICNMVCEAAMIEPKIMVIGWDVAITPNGPMFVEGNRRPGFDLVQILCGKGRKDIIQNAITELKER